ncbi:hypothetical protein NKY66_30820 [Sinorhizobium meliloti]|uniref:hypothetical protein n=1 Tax=Rhizobium meliloti TaxID=382 RepID=UPI003D655370
MALQDLIDDLQNATGPDRKLDAAIAKIVAIAQRSEVVTAMPPSDPSKVPHYTRLLDHAYALAQAISPSNMGGCSWEEGKGTAKLNDGPYIQAATPALALCIAALTELRRPN